MSKTISFLSSHNSRKIVTKYQLLKEQDKLRILVKEEYKRGLLISHILGQIEFFFNFFLSKTVSIQCLCLYLPLSFFLPLSFCLFLSLSYDLSLPFSFCFSLSLSLSLSHYFITLSPLLLQVMNSFSKIRLILAAILN